MRSKTGITYIYTQEHSDRAGEPIREILIDGRDSELGDVLHSDTFEETAQRLFSIMKLPRDLVMDITDSYDLSKLGIELTRNPEVRSIELLTESNKPVFY